MYNIQSFILVAMIIGVDEVGRGCLAGPVCVAAVGLEVPVVGLDDSKKLLAPVREQLAKEVKQQAAYVGIGWASHAEIDALGLTGALRAAGLRALADITHAATEILLDGNHNYLRDSRVRTIIGGDGLEPRISAASIVAKVARDNYMKAIASMFPHYGFGSHVGYATPQHRLAITTHGPCEVHRLSFAPFRYAAVTN